MVYIEDTNKIKELTTKVNRLLAEIQSLNNVIMEERNEVIYWQKMYESKAKIEISPQEPIIIKEVEQQPVIVEKEIPVYIEKVIEKFTEVDKPVYIEKEVIVDRIVEKEVLIQEDIPVEFRARAPRNLDKE